MTVLNDAVRLLEESLAQNESPKGSLLSAIQKLSRAASLLENWDVHKWCSIQLGDKKYTEPLQEFIDLLLQEKSAARDKKQVAMEGRLGALGLNSEIHFTGEELNIKYRKATGGYKDIGFIEETHANILKTKSGNDGTHYQNDLGMHLSYVRRRSHEMASNLLAKLKFAGTAKNSFDILKSLVDDKLLDLNADLAEQLMLAFKSVSSNSAEEWSHGMTTCRRILEGVADELRPANSDPARGKVISQAQYINRLWDFMDRAIESDTNKALAKAHVDFLGAWMEKTNKVANKGVHAEVSQIEATKAVFHLYLVLADVLNYLEAGPKNDRRPNLNSATLDEMEVFGDVSRSIAKEIVKARVEHGSLNPEILKKIPGLGVKTLGKLLSRFSLE